MIRKIFTLAIAPKHDISMIITSPLINEFKTQHLNLEEWRGDVWGSSLGYGLDYYLYLKSSNKLQPYLM